MKMKGPDKLCSLSGPFGLLCMAVVGDSVDVYLNELVSGSGNTTVGLKVLASSKSISA
jgi:hypothetical protein